MGEHSYFEPDMLSHFPSLLFDWLLCEITLSFILVMKMIHTGPVPGDYVTDWEKTKITNPIFCCRLCGSNDALSEVELLAEDTKTYSIDATYVGISGG
jgi:hypothetical protein